MVNPMKTALILLFAAVAVSAQNTTPTIAARTAAFRKIPGYFPLYWDEKAGKMWLEIDKFDTGFLYVDSMPAGMGSNDWAWTAASWAARASSDSCAAGQRC